MDRQTMLILALGLLAAAGFTVAVSGFLLRGRLKRAAAGPGTGTPPDAEVEVDTPTDTEGGETS